MADRSSIDTIAGLDISPTVTAPTWPPTAIAVTKKLPLLAESFSRRAIVNNQNLIDPATGQASSVPLGEIVRGGLILSPTYNAIEHLWALAVGRMPFSISGTQLPEELVAGAYRHTYEIDPVFRSHAWTLDDGVELDAGVDLDQQILSHGILAVDRGDVVWEFNGVSLLGFRLSTSPAATILELTGQAYDLDLASVVNTNLSTLTEPAWQDIIHVDLEMLIAPQSTITPLSASDRIDVGELRLSLVHPLVHRQRADTGLFVGAPRRTRLPVTAGFLRLLRYADDVLHNWALSGTQLMASISFQGGIIGATAFSYELTFYLPSLRLVNPRIPTTGGTVYAQTYDLQISVPEDDFAGMPQTVNRSPLIVQVVSEESSHPLYP